MLPLAIAGKETAKSRQTCIQATFASTRMGAPGSPRASRQSKYPKSTPAIAPKAFQVQARVLTSSGL